MMIDKASGPLVKCAGCEVTDDDLQEVQRTWQKSVVTLCPACLADFKEMLNRFSLLKQEENTTTATGRLA